MEEGFLGQEDRGVFMGRSQERKWVLILYSLGSETTYCQGEGEEET